MKANKATQQTVGYRPMGQRKPGRQRERWRAQVHGSWE